MNDTNFQLNDFELTSLKIFNAVYEIDSAITIQIHFTWIELWYMTNNLFVKM